MSTHFSLFAVVAGGRGRPCSERELSTAPKACNVIYVRNDQLAQPWAKQRLLASP